MKIMEKFIRLEMEKILLFVEAIDIYGNISPIDTIIEFLVNDTVKTYPYPNPAKNNINIFQVTKEFIIFLFILLMERRSMKKWN